MSTAHLLPWDWKSLVFVWKLMSYNCWERWDASCVLFCAKTVLQFDQCFRLFFGHYETMKFYKVEFTDTSSACMIARKITKILQSFSFWLELESFKSVKYSWCYEFSNVGTFFWHTWYCFNLHKVFKCAQINKDGKFRRRVLFWKGPKEG